jgi:hypothetical protein
LETLLSRDVYAFSVTDPSRTLYLDWTRPSGGPSQFDWVLVNVGTGKTVSQDSGPYDAKVGDIPPGNYQLSVSPRSTTGAYQVEFVAGTADAFDLALPALISDGVPGAGAGRLESMAARDDYRFTVPAGGQSVTLDWIQNPGSTVVTWSLRNLATDRTVTSGQFTGDRTFANLPAGMHELRVSPYHSSNVQSPYEFQLQFAG